MDTRDIEIGIYEEFYHACNPFFEGDVDNEVAYRYIVDADSKDIRDIVHLYQTIRNEDFYPKVCTKVSMRIKIRGREDLESFFLGNFCECLDEGKWRIKKIFDKIDFFYDIYSTDISDHKKVLECFEKFNRLRNEEKYLGFSERISTDPIICIQNCVYFLIFDDEDYNNIFLFFEACNGSWTIKKKYKNMRFIFLIGYSNANITPMLLHNYLLLYNKIDEMKNCEVHVNIPTEEENLIKHASGRAQTYLLNMHGFNFFLNRRRTTWNISSVGKLPPAIYISDDEELSFFSKPIQECVWNKVIKFDNNDKKKYRIDDKTFSKGTLEQKFWPYLRICQKYLVEPYDEIISKPYEELRREAYRSNAFYKKYISRIPFLAVYFFAFYDSFYRSELLLEMKEATIEYKKSLGIRMESDLQREDISLSEQYRQKWNVYSIYERMKEETDVKNLLIEAGGEESKLHKTIEAEIFESISIAEGLLQIIENAVVHAGGALLSMRVYNRAKGVQTKRPKKPDQVSYLDKVYSEYYFETLNSKFFLEVQVSDLSEISIPDKFRMNLKDDTETWGELEEYYNVSGRKLEDIIQKIDTDYFFRNSFSDELEEFKYVFYKINKNLVHHYGLEIFNAIITARKGIFSVVGHGTGYDNIINILKKSNIQKLREKGEICAEREQTKEIECVAGKIRRKIQGNKKLQGTTYRMILPLNHMVVKDTPAINNEIVIKEDINKISAPLEIKLEELLDNVISGNGVQGKQKEIDTIANNIVQKYGKSKEGTILCINLFGRRSSDIDFEVIVKGILLFGLNRIGENGYLPIAIINLTPFQLIEAARIISVYYTKSSKHSEKSAFNNMPIYLKCFEAGKEVIFEGESKRDVRETIVKNAILSGTMFDELQTIVDILKKVEN